MRVICCYSDTTASGQYRIIEPYSNIKSDIEFVITNELREPDIWADDIKAILIQRPMHPELPEMIKDLKKRGKIIVCEIDDDVTTIPASNPYFQYYRQNIKTHIECLKLSDYIHCSTPELASKYPNKSVVFLNAINIAKYIKIKKWNGGIVGLQCSPTHIDSIYLIKDVVYELLNNKTRVAITSNLDWLKKIFHHHHYLELNGWVSVEESYKIPLNFDVNLTPLPDTMFNRSKSELKIIEAAICGVPSVSSSVAPFLRFNKLSNGANVIIKKEKKRYWLESIYSLLNNDEYRNKQSDSGNQAIYNHYSLELINNKRAIWWNQLLKK